MSQERIPAAVVQGRRVAIVLLLTAMALTIALVILMLAW